MQEEISALVSTLDITSLRFIEACVRKEQARRHAPVSELPEVPVRSKETPGSSFTVPETVRYLTTEQIDGFSDAFRRWHAEAGTAGQKRSRGRLWLVFLLIRHAALRLGEALSLNDIEDIDAGNSLIIVRGQTERRLQISRNAMNEVQQILESPVMFSLRGSILHLDQGYVRRTFYARGRECGLPSGLSSPRVLRHSRGIELLRGDMPLKLVQTFLGQRSPVLAASYLHFPDEEARRLMHRHLRREALRRTSARNAFTGTVSRVTRGRIMTEVELTTEGGLTIVSVITTTSAANLDIRVGTTLTATVKAPWIFVMRAGAVEEPNAPRDNRLFGAVETVRMEDVEAEILLALDDGTPVCALLTRHDAESLGLAPGVRAEIRFNPFAVILGI